MSLLAENISFHSTATFIALTTWKSSKIKFSNYHKYFSNFAPSGRVTKRHAFGSLKKRVKDPCDLRPLLHEIHASRTYGIRAIRPKKRGNGNVPIYIYISIYIYILYIRSLFKNFQELLIKKNAVTRTSLKMVKISGVLDKRMKKVCNVGVACL